MSSNFDIEKFFQHVTSSAGVYVMYDTSGSIIYIGKAKNLRNRLRSYFYRQLHDIKTSALVDKISNIEVIPTKTEYDAIVLEDELIIKHIPKYNIKLHNKKYPYFALSGHPYPQLSITRKADNVNFVYLGPFTNPKRIKDFMRSLQKIFRLRTCSDFNFHRRKHPCIQYHIKQCTAPCVNLVSKHEYMEQVEQFRLALSGNMESFIEQLRLRMNESAAQRDFLRAAYYRDQINNCEEVRQNDLLDPVIIHSINYKIIDQRVAVVLISNKCLEAEEYYVEELPNYLDPKKIIHDLLHRFIYKYYLSTTNPVLPTTIVLPSDPAIDDELKTKIIERAKHKINFSDDETWQKMAFLQASAQLSRMYRSSYTAFDALSKHLGYQISLIAGFDISHHQGEATVASCVYFDASGELLARNKTYELLAIKNDDYLSLSKALKLALSDWHKENQHPDLVVIDGGKNHLNIALDILSDLNIKVISISKKPGRISGQETIHESHASYRLDEQNIAFLLLRQIRDSAHNLAIKRSGRILRDARMFSSLEKIPGVGKTRSALLLQHFHDLNSMKLASPDDLKKLLRINNKLALSIWEYLQIL